MSQLYFSIILLLLLQMISSKSYSQDESQTLEGPYLGQKQPGSTPEIFAFGFVSSEHRDFSGFFTPDMKEFYFTRKDNNNGKWSLVTFKLEKNIWRESIVGPRVGRPFISPDGNTFHLGKHFRENTDAGCSKIKSLGSYYEDIRITRLTSSLKGTYVFDEGAPGGNGVIRYSRLINGQREAPKVFGKEINTGKWNAHPFIAADESYIIWDGEREIGFGRSDLYISFKKKDGSWGLPLT